MYKKKEKGQVATEFMIFVGLGFILAIVMAAIGTSQIKELSNYKEDILTKDLALKVQSELNLAAEVEEGYIREFEVPQELDNINYSIFILNNVLTVKSKNSLYVLPIPKLVGNVTKGINAINKTNGVLYLNSGVPTFTTSYTVCQNAESLGLCWGLDILYGSGYACGCCSEHSLCCSACP